MNKFKQIKAKHEGAKIVKPNIKPATPLKDLIKRVEEIEKKLNGIKGFN
jgi:hypothetical protein